MNAITPTGTRSRSTDIDKAVGAQVRLRRTELGLSQQQVADLLGVTYQQAHKYERGINRISAGRLYEIATVLKVRLPYFYENLDQIEATSDRGLLDLVTDYKAVSSDDQAFIRQTARHLSRAGQAESARADVMGGVA
tara:strand:+ start:300 stop:710 length:411 start_codon:yes stop_codon:yes gene_type:complete